MERSSQLQRSTLYSLPPELTWKVCHHIQDNHNPQDGQSPLLPLASTCKSMYGLVSPLAWESLHISFDRPTRQDERVLQDLLRLATQPDHPTFPFTKSIKIELPYFSAVTSDAFCRQLDAALASLLRRLTALATVALDLSMIKKPLIRFRHTLEAILDGRQSFRTVSLVGLVTEIPLCASLDNNLTSLRVEMVGNGLPFDFANFPHLRRICLGIDCREEQLANPSSLKFPSTMWRTLECFVLEVYGWEVQANMISEAIVSSMQKAEQVALQELGMFMNVEQDDQQKLVETILKLCPDVVRLALVIPNLPTAKCMSDLAAQVPKLIELTVCAYLHGGTWRWSDSAAEYAQAISLFTRLQKLAINHDDLAVSLGTHGEEESSGRFSMNCSDASEVLRRAFMKQIAMVCPTIQHFAICPCEQENSRLARTSDDDGLITFVDDGTRFFWESFW